MKSTFCLLVCLPFLLASCTAYQKVSLINFKEYDVPYDEWGNLHYVLRKDRLHYSDTESRNDINYYDTDRSTLYNSHSFLIEDNVIIPTGAHGVCVNAYDDNFIIDFGDGVLVPFIVNKGNNRAESTIEVDGREYNIVVSNRTPCLYFYTRELEPAKSGHAVSREVN